MRRAGNVPPTAPGKQTGSLTVFDNASGAPQSVALSGTGVAGILKFKPAALSFKPQAVGTTSAPKTLTVLNSNSLPIAITSVTPGASFGVASDGCSGTTIAATGSCAVSVTFTPTSTGPVTGALRFVDNSTQQLVKLEGTGK